MEDPGWEARRTKLIERVHKLESVAVSLRDGGAVQIVTVAVGNEVQIQQVHSITQQAFMEFRGQLDPPNGSDTETPDDVATQLLRGGALIGYAADIAAASLRITINAEHLYIGRVGVIPSLRGKGIGRAIIGCAEQIAARCNVSEVRLGTREKLSDNVALYLKLGYEIERVMPHPRGPDNVVLFVKRIVSNAL